MYITSTGMVCSVGFSAAAACAAIRAGITKFDELPYYNTQGKLVIGAAVPELGTDFEDRKRIIELLSLALADCLRDKSPKSMKNTPLLVGLAEPGRPGGGAELADLIIREVELKLELQFHSQLSGSIPSGHTSGFKTLRLASELAQNPDIDTCVVCGVDSYINASSLLWLEQCWRLKKEENADGVIPGEAAAAVLLQRQVTPKFIPKVKVVGLGFAHEKASIMNDEPLLGLGLTEAARTALIAAGLQMHEIDFRLSDLTGESYGFKEQALALARLMRIRREELPIWNCADSIGDTGAAAGFCQLVFAFHAFRKGYAYGNRAICYTSAVSGDRAVTVLQRSFD